MFIGPEITDMGYHFICRVIYNDSTMEFDVALMVNGELLPGGAAVKHVRSTDPLDVKFTPDDFVGQFGKWVCRSIGWTLV